MNIRTCPVDKGKAKLVLIVAAELRILVCLTRYYCNSVSEKPPPLQLHPDINEKIAVYEKLHHNISGLRD